MAASFRRAFGTILPFPRRGMPWGPICLPVRSPLPQLAHALQLLQEREEDVGFPGALVALAIDEEGGSAVHAAARAGEEIRAHLLRHLFRIDVLRELVDVAPDQPRVPEQVPVLEELLVLEEQI